MVSHDEVLSEAISLATEAKDAAETLGTHVHEYDQLFGRILAALARAAEQATDFGQFLS